MVIGIAARFGNLSESAALGARVARESRAWRDAQKAMLADLPDPSEYAYQLGGEFCEMLLGATLRDSWYVTEAVAKKLRPHGLCEYGGSGLTAFAMAVRRELKAMDA